jgi:hypothetical protein
VGPYVTWFNHPLSGGEETREAIYLAPVEKRNTPDGTVATTIATIVPLQYLCNGCYSRNLYQRALKFKFELFLNYPI